MMDVSRGALLGGRIIHDQPLTGHRTGIEPVVLAASLPARPGETVVEAGTGSGAGLLCLAARVPGVRGIGIERDPGMAAVARGNVLANLGTLQAQLEIITADLDDWAPDSRCDHAFANPPWHPAAGTASPDRLRDAARRARPGLLAGWVARLGGWLRPRGTLTLVVATAAVPECLAALPAAGCGSAALCPLWQRRDGDAKIVLVRAVRGGRAPFRLGPGLVLHKADGGYTPAAEAVLRGGEGLAF